MNQNERSSRGNTVFNIYITVYGSKRRMGVINLVGTEQESAIKG